MFGIKNITQIGEILTRKANHLFDAFGIIIVVNFRLEINMLLFYSH